MEVVIIPDRASGGRLAAEAIAALVSRRPDPVLGLATGSSPAPVYDDLAARHRRGELSLARCSAYLLDEYAGLPHGHPQSYRKVISRELVDRLDLPVEAMHAPDGDVGDLLAACAAYDQAVRGVAVDLQLLGVGTDGTWGSTNRHRRWPRGRGSRR